MNKTIFNRCILLTAAVISIAFTSCQKEVLEAPAPGTDSKPVLIFIRAVEKDSSITNSEQVLLR
jgi:hypothetical protein